MARLDGGIQIAGQRGRSGSATAGVAALISLVSGQVPHQAVCRRISVRCHPHQEGRSATGEGNGNRRVSLAVQLLSSQTTLAVSVRYILAGRGAAAPVTRLLAATTRVAHCVSQVPSRLVTLARRPSPPTISNNSGSTTISLYRFILSVYYY